MMKISSYPRYTQIHIESVSSLSALNLRYYIKIEEVRYQKVAGDEHS